MATRCCSSLGFLGLTRHTRVAGRMAIGWPRIGHRLAIEACRRPVPDRVVIGPGRSDIHRSTASPLTHLEQTEFDAPVDGSAERPLAPADSAGAVWSPSCPPCQEIRTQRETSSHAPKGITRFRMRPGFTADDDPIQKLQNFAKRRREVPGVDTGPACSFAPCAGRSEC
jgi:hypothetical protein